MLILGGLLAAIRFVFEPTTVRWISFGAGAGAVIIVAAAFLSYGRGPVQRAVDVATVLTGGWVIVSALTLRPAEIGWLSVGEGGTLVALAVIGLVAHEVLMQRALWPS